MDLYSKHGLYRVLTVFTLAVMGCSSLLFFSRFGYAQINLPITVKECNGVAVNKWPVTVVVPLSKGACADTANFRLTDGDDVSLPAQFSVLNRWNDQSQSIRHLSVHFQPTVSPFQGPGTGTEIYYLKDDGPGASPASMVSVVESDTQISVETGPLSLVVNKDDFSLLDDVFLNGQLMLNSDAATGGVFQPRSEAGDIQYDNQRPDILFTVEETGPMRAVIRAEAVTLYNNTEDHQHGFAVRIYAYAGKPFVKIDYQLQNSAKNVEYAWPLYFESLNLEFPLALGADATVRIGQGEGQSLFSTSLGENGYCLAQDFHNTFKIYENGQAEPAQSHSLENGQGPEGFIDIDDGAFGVMAATRYFWQTWPNGLAVDGQNRLKIELFPQWSAQYQDNQISSTGLYWLEDMQHTYKEVLLYFHQSGVADQTLRDMAKTFNYHPVGTLPVSWYKETKASLDLDGIVPIDASTASEDKRLYEYSSTMFGDDHLYNFGWDNFLLDVFRKDSPSATGNWPYSVADFISTENPADYWHAEQFAMGELNVRPQWIAQYSHDTDYELLKLTENPYGGWSWRNFKGHGTSVLDAAYLDGTAQDAKPRDDQHAWFYHMEEAYNYTANPWIRDWYEFIAEFRKVRLQVLDPFPDNSNRAKGHSLHHALQALRVTGQSEVLDLASDYVRTVLRSQQRVNRHGGLDSLSDGGDAAFQAGYLARAVISFLHETEKEESVAYGEGFNLVAGIMEWNLNYCNFSHFMDANDDEIGSSNGTGLTLVDPVAWYYWHSGNQDILNHLDLYLTEGINGGNQPYQLGELTSWTRDFVGRYNHFIHTEQRADITPPSAVEDLKVAVNGDEASIVFTPPSDASEYHILYSDKPIASSQTMDETRNNWWAASSAGFHTIETPGEIQSATFAKGDIDPLYAAVVCSDQAGNMGSISMASSVVDTQAPSPPGNLTGEALSGSQIRLTWSPASDDIGVSGYRIYRGGVEIGTATDTVFDDSGLTPDTAYGYEVSAYDVSANESEKAGPVNVATMDDSDDTPQDDDTPQNDSGSSGGCFISSFFR